MPLRLGPGKDTATLRKTPYPSRLEPRLKRNIVNLGLMSQEQIEEAARSVRRGKGFQWPEFLAMGPGAFIGSWNPPASRGLAEWMADRARHYGCQLEVVVEELTDGSGKVEFRCDSTVEGRRWSRLGRAYRAIERAFGDIVQSACLNLKLEQLEPHEEVFEWVIIRTGDRTRFLEHLRGEREWHSLLSRSYQLFSEAQRRDDTEAQLKFARRGVVAGEYMRRCGGDFSHHTMQVVEMYEWLGKGSAAVRWRRYQYKPARGLI